jgi:hypothetical protein
VKQPKGADHKHRLLEPVGQEGFLATEQLNHADHWNETI